MAREGMVHALVETWRLLKLDGVLVNILPASEGTFFEVHHDGIAYFSECNRETLSEDVLQAEAAIRQVHKRGLFYIDQEDEFEFYIYGSSVSEVRAYWEEQNAFDEELKSEERLAREDLLFEQVNKIMDELGDGAEVALRERVRIARLRPLK